MLTNRIRQYGEVIFDYTKMPPTEIEHAENNYRRILEYVKSLNEVPATWTNLDYENLTQEEQDRVWFLFFTSQVELEMKHEYFSTIAEGEIKATIIYQGYGDVNNDPESLKNMRIFGDKARKKNQEYGITPGVEPYIENRSFPLRWRLTTFGKKTLKQYQQIIQKYSDQQLLENRLLGIAEELYARSVAIRLNVSYGLLKLQTAYRVISRNITSTSESPTGKTASNKKTQLPPLDEVLKLNLEYPTDEQENDDWTLAENIGIQSHRTQRSKGEKKSLPNGQIAGRDPQGRIWWKPEEDSQKVFYLKSSLRPVTKSSKKKK